MSLNLGSTTIGSLYLGSTKVGEACLGSTKVYSSAPADPYNPLGLPPVTIRLKFRPGVTPSFSSGTGVQVSSSPNVWDLTTGWTTSWGELLYAQNDLIEVLGANSTGVTTMSSMFRQCTSLTTVAVFDTSRVVDIAYMFDQCSSLTTVPLFDTSSVTEANGVFRQCSALTTVPVFNTSSVTAMNYMFQDWSALTTVPLLNTSSAEQMNSMFAYCYAVQSGALALYQQASTQANPPWSHSGTFRDCGRDTVSGAAELAQIPSGWK